MQKPHKKSTAKQTKNSSENSPEVLGQRRCWSACCGRQIQLFSSHHGWWRLWTPPNPSTGFKTHPKNAPSAGVGIPSLPCLPCAPTSRGLQQVLDSPGKSSGLGGSWGCLASLCFWEKVAEERQEPWEDGECPAGGCCSLLPVWPPPCPLRGQLHHLHRCPQVLVAPPSRASQAAPGRQNKRMSKPPPWGYSQAPSLPQ